MNARQFILLLFSTELILSGFWYTGGAVTAMLLLAATIAGCLAVAKRRELQVYTLSGLMLLYLLWLLAVGFLSHVPETAMMTLAALAGLPVMYLFATNTPAFAAIWRYLRLILFILGVMSALWAVWQVAHHISNAQGPFQDRNVFAAFMNLLWFPVAFVLLTHDKNRYHLKLIALSSALFIIGTALFATTSRAGIATWLLLLPVFLLAAYRSSQCRHRIAWVVLITLLAYLCSSLLLNATIAERSFVLSQDPSTNARLLLWQSSIKMLFAHPVTGSGWGTFVHYYPAYRVPLETMSAGFFAHNDYLQLAVEGGIPALLLQIGLGCGLLIQLRRSLQRAADVAAFESVSLLLGVLALFIHASANFIFYLACMNIVAGLYLARAAHLADKVAVIAVPAGRRIHPFLKYPAAAFVITLLAVPYVVHLLGQSINKQSNVKLENLLADKYSAYRLAELISVIQPQQRIAQETILQTAELALADRAFISRVGHDSYHRLLALTVQRFDKVRALHANDAGVGVREAGILLQHHAAFDSGFAYSKAHQVLKENLQANPYHVDSIITLARLQRAEGQTAAALQTIQQAGTYVFMPRDKQLIHIEWLRQLAAPQALAIPQAIAELDAIEKDLRKLRLGSETGIPLILPASYYPQIDARLAAIAQGIQPKAL